MKKYKLIYMENNKEKFTDLNTKHHLFTNCEIRLNGIMYIITKMKYIINWNMEDAMFCYLKPIELNINKNCDNCKWNIPVTVNKDGKIRPPCNKCNDFNNWEGE